MTIKNRVSTFYLKTHAVLTASRVTMLHKCASVFASIYFLQKSLFLFYAAAAAAKSLQSCPAPCDPIDSSPRPWDSPGKNTGVGCHFLLYVTIVNA